MRKFRKSKAIKIISLLVAINFLTELFYPTVALALTAGPNAPEFSGFTPVSTTDMVNLSTGDFNYNLPVIEIPGGEGGGYALSLSYNSGVSSESEASWVGFGWNLNPGAINRNVNGLPDDYNGEDIRSYNKTKPNWSVTKSRRAGIEFFSYDKVDKLPINLGGLSVSNTVRFNSFNGFMATYGAGLHAFGLSARANFDPNGVTFSGSINPIAMLSTISHLGKDPAQQKTETSDGLTYQQRSLKKSINKIAMNALSSMYTGAYSSLIRCNQVPTSATNLTKYYGYGINGSFSLQLNFSIPVGFEVGFSYGYNMQTNQYSTDNHSFGYIYAQGASNAYNQRMDYFVEKPGSSFNKRDYFIGIPFNNNDYFHVTGEGLTGSFKPIHSTVGHYIPTFPKEDGKDMKIFNTGFELMVGNNFGLGADIGLGWKDTKIDLVDKTPSVNKFSSKDDVQFRFKNDKGGEVKFSKEDDTDDSGTKILTAGINTDEKNFIESSNVDINSNRTGNRGASSFIDFHTLNDINTTGKKFNKELVVDTDIDRIVEYSIYNDNGYRYVYGQPVFVKNSTNLMIDVDPVSDNIPDDNYLVYKNLLLFNENGKYTANVKALASQGGHKQVVGEVHTEEYANNFLLTSITGPNYIDVNNNGPDDQDFGTWTKYNYRKVHSNYRFRNPYTGLYYQKSSLSDSDDDIGSITTGEKEIYYLESIETNTHIAFFVTNTFTEVANGRGYITGDGSKLIRYDGLEAKDIGAVNDPAANDPNAYGTDRLQCLEKIVLFSKERREVPIKTVHFKYDYSLIPGTPNSIDTNGYKKGKLTLTKLWFTYNGTSPAKISPYEFSYNYKISDLVTDQRVKDYLSDYDKYDDPEENPVYSPHLLDPWGNIMQYGINRHKYLIPWNYHGHNPDYANNLINSWRRALPPGDYDPGAWHLKQIKLPTGGEILIQYEENTYKTVQDKPVMAMTSLLKYVNTDASRNPLQEPYYFVNLDDLGIDLQKITPTELENYLTDLKKYFGIDGGSQNDGYVAKNKIYFKFLFDLTGNAPNVNSKHSEYITGYANVVSIDLAVDPEYGNTLKFTLGKEGTFQGRSALTPEVAAYEFYVNTRQGRLDESKFSSIFLPGILNGANTFAENDAFIMNEEKHSPLSFLGDNWRGKIFNDILPLWYGFGFKPEFNTKHKDDICLNLSPALSYLKIPMYGEKKGGGSRVKRLMIYDDGSGAGEEMIFGSEYHYVLNDGKTSSGVATNEPVREENPFINYMFRGSQSNFDRLTSGEEKKQTEGPLGETLLPSPSVNYSRVVVNNIHSGNTGTGFTVSEYFTTKDYPFDGSYKTTANNTPESIEYDLESGSEGVKVTRLRKDQDILFLPLGLLNIDNTHLTYAQGFRFIRNNMNGQLKSITSFGGIYNPNPEENKNDTDNGYVVAYQKNTYYEPGEKVKVLSWDSTNKVIKSAFELPGKEIEIAYEKKRFKDLTFNFSIEFDISFTPVPPIFFTLMPTIDIANNYTSMHATSKIIDYPVILKSVENYKDGIISKTENIGFSDLNGTPIYTKTYDSYDGLEFHNSGTNHIGSIYSLNIPAAWMYPDMGQKANGNDDKMNSLNAVTAQITAYGVSDNYLIENFKPGIVHELNSITSLSVQTYESSWYNELGQKAKEVYNITSPDAEVLAAINRIRLPHTTYAYNAQENDTYNPYEKTWNSGWFKIDKMFDWETLPAENDPNWVAATSVTKYSPNGMPLEERNALGISSAVMYGSDYGNHLPVILAQNADYNSIYFNSFEKIGNSLVKSHSGYYSKEIITATNILPVKSLYSTSQLKEKGALIKFWSTAESASEISCSVSGTILVLEAVARTGEWTLFSAIVSSAVIPDIDLEISSITIAPLPGTVINIDDFRFQPLESSSTCYVYDMFTFKLLTQFDDQHFGLYYKYNSEGQLVRKMIETERGMKTIQENQYHTVQK